MAVEGAIKATPFIGKKLLTLQEMYHLIL